jgi:DNA processing protein
MRGASWEGRPVFVSVARVDDDELTHLLAILALTGEGRAAFRRSLAPHLVKGVAVVNALDSVAAAHGAQAASVRRRVRARDAGLLASLRFVRAEGVSVLRLGGDDYPGALAQIPDPPLGLVMRGGPLPATRNVAVVGSRRCRRHSAQLAFELARRLAERGFAVVSGLAEGVDGSAHRGALDAGGPTAAVLGNGLAHCYPAWHRGLAERIVAAGGLLVSEYPPHWRPRAHYFPERNRIISGLTEAVLVVEASARSGSLITARLALEQGRDVLAVPGAVADGTHRGCHRLLRDGAALVEDVDDLWAALGVEPEPAASEDPAASLDGDERRLLDVIGAEPRSTDALVEALGVPAARVLSLLTELELKGFVQAVGDGYIRRPF